ncbi:plexin-A2-like isoform X3 [Haliotis rufescens]|uniref:plexin-A2-like isoform X3 n=1 Tax=Haliotis rufescens TaxID=6454 RepID=UPI00201F4336|nr:plexin-A2-like isoform X3 [Haliotis rufescens]
MTPWRVLVAVTIICVICPCVELSAVRYEVASFEGNEVFNHLVWNRETQTIYIGAVNVIYKLDQDLNKLTNETTGPQEDNPNCPPLISENISKCSLKRTKTDAFNKILVIDYTHQRLIACFNLYHGYCEKYHLDDIKKKDDIQHIPIVSNMINASSFAFIAPGPAKEPGGIQEEVLYVSATWSTQGLKVYRDQIPAFASRNLDTFKLGIKNFRKSRIEIESQQRDTFPVRYIYGFGSGKFSYMLTVQKQGAQLDNFISKIFRVCQNDAAFYSYTEVELKCMYGQTHYNILRAAYVGKAGKNLAQGLNIPTVEDVLYAVFSLGESYSKTALCVYPMREVHKSFTENIQSCFQGIGNTGPDHIVGSGLCVKANFNITDDYCGEHDINNPIDGNKPITADAALRFGSHTNVSAITVAITHDYTVAFVGTSRGNIIKVTIESRKVASVYDNVTVQEGSMVNADLRMDDQKLHLYVMTEKRLSKLKVQECSQYKTCGECLGAKDPYCGWCSLENKINMCSRQDECKAYEMTMRWLPYSGQQCTNITRVVPEKIQKDHSSKTHTLELHIENLPDFPGQYECAFSHDMRFVPIITIANKTMNTGKNTGVTCQTPLPNQLPMVPTGQDHIVMRLSVRMNQQDFVSTDFTFFDCSLHNSCTSCTQSDFPCTWCIKGHICSNIVSDDCRRNETLVTGKAVRGTSLRPGPKTCPRIEMINDRRDPQILVAANTNTGIEVRGLHLEAYQIGGIGLKCNFNFKSGITVPATVLPSTDNDNSFVIKCQNLEFNYFPNVSYQNVPFNIMWENIKALDNPSNIQVTMYKCHVMADSCGSCLTQDVKYQCGWCQDKEHCTTQQECRNNNDWLGHQSTCRNPKIETISPQSGPLDGGTLLTIVGENLGKMKGDLHVTIGPSVDCAIKEYVAPRQIICETGPVPGEQEHRVKVKIANEYESTSANVFRYVLPKVTDINPDYGPRSGGTRVTISGQNMDAGTEKTVYINSHQCNVIPVPSSPDYLVCETSPKSQDSSPNPTYPPNRVVVKFDKQVIHADHKIRYAYVPDPDVTSINPKQAIRSGGLRITVRGKHFTNVQSPRMLLGHNNEVFDSMCERKSDIILVCYSPMVESLVPTLSDDVDHVDVSYGFKMDGVENIMNLTGRSLEAFGVFTLYPDPVFEKFKNGMKSHQKKTEFLTIGGSNLNPAIPKEDVTVHIGTGLCNVTSIAATQLTCRPPKSQPQSKKGNDIPEVVVIVGQNLTFSIGRLKYEEAEMLTLPTIIGIAVGAGVLVLLVIIVIIAYQVKSRRSNDMMKRMRIQMDSLEARVANECKEAFAELQTDMTELTSDLYGQVSIPFWDYRTYCMKVLFPGVENHSVIKELQVGYRRNQEDVERGLALFFQLMSNKTFLLIFIRTLESSKTFQLRDRVNVASLITVALQTKMEYATDILKTLLADLIEKSVEGKNHPKLLLRRNESVAEKMLTNWFSFLLYKFLKECAGEPLFMLYQAIKQQVSKGPVDSVTSEARYSLSEDKLIRQQINYKIMTLNVLDMDSYAEQKQTHTVKVLDCDTISQIKEKILDAMYKNAPFSSRPAKEDLDLEWLCHEKSRQLILHDEDTSSKTESDCKRLNTLNHYQVPDGAYVAIVPKQDSVYNSSIISDKSNKFDQMPFNRSPPMSRTVISPQSVTVDFDNNGVKFYHLVRHHDTDAQKEGDRGSKMVTEIYLPRLLVTKGTLQQFVDDLFERIFSTAHRGSALPLAIKYMFDFLDDQALLHNIQEHETVHTWKSNSLPLRFWVNVIKNPNFVFDIYKSPIVDSCLTVVGQTFMDSCSVSEHRLGKDSPSSKLLYAKDIPKYKKWVERYYQDIKMMPAISDQDMTAMLTEESRLHQGEFNTNAALMELYKYIQKYYEEIMCALEEASLTHSLTVLFLVVDHVCSGGGITHSLTHCAVSCCRSCVLWRRHHSLTHSLCCFLL